MTRLPQRQTLVVQLSDIIQENIRAGRWTEWLPEERELARLLHVGRSTLRAALAALRKQGILETHHGLGTRVARKLAAHSSLPRNKSVGILMPRTLDRYKHFVALVVDDLHVLLFDNGYSLAVHAHPQVEAQRPFGFLRKLVDQHRYACWLLIGCGPATRRWFSENSIPTVVSGTCEESLNLPFVCLANFALGRHAALKLLRQGHRQIGALLTRSNSGLRDGLLDVLDREKAAGATFQAFETDDTVESIAMAVDRMMQAKHPPTAIFVAESNFYLTLSARLAQRSLRVPNDVSLLCRDDEPYLSSLLPAPARYSKNPHAYAKKLAAHILPVSRGEPIQRLVTRIMPEFVPGNSLGSVAVREAAAPI